MKRRQRIQMSEAMNAARHSATPPLQIAMAADAAYAMPLATALRSLVENNTESWPLSIHILHDDIDDNLKAKVAASLPSGSTRIAWHSVDPTLFADQYSVLPHISKMTYARFLLPRILENISDRILYLDSDILVIKPIAPLWETDLHGAAVGAVLDPIDGFVKSNKRGLELVPRVDRYFNAGVLLIDLARWREERVVERAVEYLDRFPASPFSDQDALNVVCDRRWKELGGEWNFQCDPTQSVAAIRADRMPSIIHFTANLKPWKPGSLSVNASYYNAFRRRTLFALTRSQHIRDVIRRLGHKALRRSSLLLITWKTMKALAGIGPVIHPSRNTTKSFSRTP